MLMRPDGKPKGIAFIEFSEHNDAKKALAENGKVIDGRDLRVAYSGGKPAGGD
jgi:RNA recognition motif-containing protein